MMQKSAHCVWRQGKLQAPHPPRLSTAQVISPVEGSLRIKCGHLVWRKSVPPTGTLTSRWLLTMTVALASLVVTSAEAFRFPQSSSSSSSLSSAAEAVANADQLSHLVTNSVLDPNRAPAAVLISPKVNFERVLGEHQSQQMAGQKETEQAMNPNEVLADNQVAILEPIAEWQTDMDLGLDELDKRAKWTNLQGGWGKRMATSWNKLSAAWGKRKMPNGVNAWNSLPGMWGKKRAKWNELSGMWGKRAWSDMKGGWGKKKRSVAPHWNKLRGMWGKRSAIAPLASSSESKQ